VTAPPAGRRAEHGWDRAIAHDAGVDPALVPAGAPDAQLRMSLCSAQLIGLGTARYIIGSNPWRRSTPSGSSRSSAPSCSAT
jgi:hypothetical protein